MDGTTLPVTGNPKKHRRRRRRVNFHNVRTENAYQHLQSESNEQFDDNHNVVNKGLEMNECGESAPMILCEQSGSTEYTDNFAVDEDTSSPTYNSTNLMTQIHDGINRSKLDCPICMDPVTRLTAIWACKKCYLVFHFNCIKIWSRSEMRTPNAIDNSGKLSLTYDWRCPGCNTSLNRHAVVFTCWCGKEHNPKNVIGLPPYSCGQTCAKNRNNCPHSCPLMCHAGACPPCTLVGPEKSCFCGAKTKKNLCAETDYNNGWSCNSECGRMMPCGVHECKRVCHEGDCGQCKVPIEARCYCGIVTRSMLCFEQSKSKPSEAPEVNDAWIGVFSCNRPCERMFDCTKHKCTRLCHPRDRDTAHCPWSIDLITHCLCGKTRLENFSNGLRKSCEDAIPKCGDTCLKLLECGHLCQSACHELPCPPCTKTIEIPCQCGNSISRSLCQQKKQMELPMCYRVCREKMSCGRHTCSQRCCTGKDKATKRLAAKRKLSQLGTSEETIEAEHICLESCNRVLKCGLHRCGLRCHRGPCPPCLEAIFEDIYCNCRKTVLNPPQPCGTSSPVCGHPCRRPKPCGHSQVEHACHWDFEPCPRCPFFTVKLCQCGNSKFANQPCWKEVINCGKVCGKQLQCEAHFCQKVCHKEGDCESSTYNTKLDIMVCNQSCNRTLNCGHRHKSPCHGLSPCVIDQCDESVTMTCPCGDIKDQVRCSKYQEYDEEVVPLLVDCRMCRLFGKKKSTALTLNAQKFSEINLPKSSDDESIVYSRDTIRFYDKQRIFENNEELKPRKNWLKLHEDEVRTFAISDGKWYYFKPMPRVQRKFIHLLCNDFKIFSFAQDEEPHRHVVARKSKAMWVPAVPLYLLRNDNILSYKGQRAEPEFTMEESSSKINKFNGGQSAQTMPSTQAWTNNTLTLRIKSDLTKARSSKRWVW